ncbi:protease modulator HflK [Novosphingobium lentum]|uniref:protease modulator HflK n=1 Tax=Novosphingobium lentum TaxID=145287 RepID=UPI00082FE0EE|nr:protease modulator HflK [Novosphingobium lentum]
MAGKRSPWGTPGGDGEPEGADPSAGDSAGEGTPPNKPRAGAPKGDGPKGDGPKGDGPRNPWLPPGDAEPPRRSASIEDIFRARTNKGGGPGGGGGMPRLPRLPDGRSWLPIAIAVLVVLWLGSSMVHRIAPQEKGVVTTLGKFSSVLSPGTSLTLPWPIQNVAIKDVTSIRRDSMPDGEGERLMLTADQNLIDLSYLVRWNIKDIKLYSFQLAEPDATVKEVAEAAMRQSIAEATLNDAMGSGRALIEQNVRERMQRILDAYRSGVKIQGVEIKKTDPPTKVVDAFKDVLAAQQDAQSRVNQAEAWAQQLTARAQGDAAAFDKVYEQYKLAPEVTRRRMYYETMERVLSQTDKVIIETPGGVTPYLPLPQIKAAPQPASSAAPGEER